MSEDDRLLLAARIAHELYAIYRGSDNGIETITQATRWVAGELEAALAPATIPIRPEPQQYVALDTAGWGD